MEKILTSGLRYGLPVPQLAKMCLCGANGIVARRRFEIWHCMMGWAGMGIGNGAELCGFETRYPLFILYIIDV